MDILQQAVYKTRYARFLPEEHRREHWPETVSRYMHYMHDHCKFKLGYTLTADEYMLLDKAILNLEVMPSMRALMTAGKALDVDNVAGYNCFSKDTKFLTKEGYKTFATANKTEDVLCSDGEWRKATVNCFGKQSLNRVSFRAGRKSNVTHTVEVTGNHTWDTLNRGIVTDLKVGDSVRFNGVPKSDFNLEDFLRGFLFGDGSAQGDFARVRLCGKKARLLPKFLEYGNCTYSYSISTYGDPVVYFKKGVFTDCKELPEVITTSWLEGYYAADGTQASRQTSLSLSGPDLRDAIIEALPQVGYCMTGINSYSDPTNFGPRTQTLYKIGIREEVIFYVSDIEYDVAVEDVWCVTEPVTHTFTLEHGILTRNCAYMEVSAPECFSEALYILMNGTGIGFSCERNYIGKLPDVPKNFYNTDGVIVVQDSKIGWANAYKELISSLYAGVVPKVDYSLLRAAGERLKTFGGRASGPEPLKRLFEFTTETFKSAAGKKLTSIEVHDIMCVIGEVVVVGGVRRSALISLSNLSDLRMREAKVGAWWEHNKHRALANNSVAYTEKPDVETYFEEFSSLVRSKSGERGIFNRVAARRKASREGRRSADIDYGCNPCSEIILRDKQFCNLSETICREHDSVETLRRKVQVAAILGTIQASLTDFQFLRPEWAKNCKEEALLGVSMTGIFDCNLLKNAHPRLLQDLRELARQTNEIWAKKLGINVSAAITCVKPSGTVSQLVDSASGIHPRFSKYYIRNIRLDDKDPVCQFLTKHGVPSEPDVNFPSQSVFSFPVKAPDGAMTRDDMTAEEHLEEWLKWDDVYCEHKPSVTISVHQDEWPGVFGWVWKHFHKVSGVSFLPHTEHTYQQAPYIPIDKEQYEVLKNKMPFELPWEELVEETDVTTSSQEMACEGERCSIG